MKNKYTVYIHIFPNQKIYVGQTCQTVAQRWSNGKGYKGQLVGKAIEKYGWDNIQHIIIKKNITKEEADELEIHLIQMFNSRDELHGYNIAIGGEGNCKGRHLPESHKKKISDSHKKKVCCYTREGTLIGTFESIMMASETVKGSFRVISACCNGAKKSAYGYVWRFEKDSFDKFETKNNVGGIKGHPVIAHTKDGNFVGIFKTAKEASEKLNVNHTSICLICRGKKPQSKGLIFHYYDDKINETETEVEEDEN